MEEDDALRARMEACRRQDAELAARGHDAKPVAEAVADLMAAPWFSRHMTLKAYLAAWPEVVGAEAAEHCELLGAANGVLRVRVDSAACRQELENFRKWDILAALKEHKGCRNTSDVKFELGELERGK